MSLNRSNFNQTKRSTPTALSLLSILVVLVACQPQPGEGDSAGNNALSAVSPSNAAIAIRVATVILDDSAERFQTSGVTSATKQASLSFQASGRLSQRMVRVGAQVKQGDVLAVIDNPSATPAASAANQQWKAAQAQLRQAEANAERFTALLAQKAITQQEFEEVEQVVLSARAQERTVKAQAQGAQRALDELSLVAPFDGVITADFSNIGALVAAGQVVMQLADPSSVEVEVSLSPLLLNQLEVGSTAFVSSSLDNALRDVPGTIVFKSPFTASGSVAQVVIALPADKVQPGTAVEVELPLMVQPTIKVPLRSVFRIADQQAAVYKVVDGVAQLVRIDLQAINADQVVIELNASESSGPALKAGDLIATDGVSKLYDGAPVEIL